MASSEPGKSELSAARTPVDVASTGELSFARGLWRMSGARTSAGNQLALLVDGPRTFAEMIDTIDTARTEVVLENYIIYADETGKRFSDALARAAARGARVRVLADWIGSRTTRGRFWNGMRQRGVYVRVFGRPRLGPWLGLLPRDHRKQLVVDGQVGFTGGFGIGDPWGAPLPADSAERPWRDTGVRIEGPAAHDMMRAFERMWQEAGGGTASTEPSGARHALAVDSTEGGLVGIIEGVPGRLRLERGFHFQAAAAMYSIWIANAYFIPTPSELEALVLAAADGVDVRLLVPSRSDHPWVRRLTRRNYRRLRSAGVRIWEWQGAMMHAKTSVVDRRWVRIGSTDINPLGVAINYELDAVICDAAFGEAAAAQYVEDVDRSHEIR
jgi:cardiolipin synthase